jgi:hypothetical protein
LNRPAPFLSILCVAALCSVTDAQTSARKPPKPLSGIFPPDNPWNQDVSRLPVHPLSQDYLASIGLTTGLHADFGTVYNGAPNGIPYNIINPYLPRTTVTFEYADESDAGPYPIPANPLIEGGPNAPLDSDRHILMLDLENKKLYELYQAVKQPNGSWRAGSGAIFDLTSNKLRPAGWTSADAAGLPIFPGLARYDEIVQRGELKHALRFTVSRTQRAYISPARHWASSSTDPKLPPMGLRLRLRANFDVSKHPASVRVILNGLKTYGMLLADNGSSGFISGAPDPRWSDNDLSTLRTVRISDFEAVQTGPLVTQ